MLIYYFELCDLSIFKKGIKCISAPMGGKRPARAHHRESEQHTDNVAAPALRRMAFPVRITVHGETVIDKSGGVGMIPADRISGLSTTVIQQEARL